MEIGKKYRSRIDLSCCLFGILFAGSFVIPLTGTWAAVLNWFYGFCCVYQIYFYIMLWYAISPSGKLRIKNGFLYREIDVMTITSIAPSRVKTGSAALALDGLEITIGSTEKVYLSPRKQAEFTKSLTDLNPTIALNIQGCIVQK